MPLSTSDLACWLLKSAGWPDELPRRPDAPVTVRRCLRPSYRLGLMRPGQPCVLWISGRVDPGVAAVGRLVSDVDEADGVQVLLSVLPSTVPRADLLLDPVFRRAEVVRMAAGSNPSYLDDAQLAALLDQLGPEAPAGWPASF